MSQPILVTHLSNKAVPLDPSKIFPPTKAQLLKDIIISLCGTYYSNLHRVVKDMEQG